ncbi:AraC family transcriptional regulator [Clostridium sp. Marseille-P299]|uniref:AraC family transcriptional regulator n=1 Tax=Clostridium sp. Marseille-P299 TaxID=1805477 RepID=UPI0008346D67|nr:AraC family transcriptional regulator [Clostridium sp. Marseille-P299]
MHFVYCFFRIGVKFKNRMVQINKNFPFFEKPIKKEPFFTGIKLLHYIDASFGTLLLHEHDHIEVMLILEGSIEVAVSGTRYRVPRNGMITIPPHQIHRTIILKETKRYERMVLHIFPEYLDQIIPKSSGYSFAEFTKQVHVIEYAPETLLLFRTMFERMFYSLRQETKYQDLIIPCQVIEFFTNLKYTLAAQARSPVPASNNLVFAAIKYINEHFTDPEFTINDLLSVVHVSHGYLSRLFKSYTGDSIYHFLLCKRLFYAKELLISGLSVQDSCMYSGFTDYTSFLKSFKYQFKETPSQLRKKYLSDVKQDWPTQL